MGTLATSLVLLKARDPESKGIVERRNGWFETSFMPGREFRPPADFNEQFTDWLGQANQKIVRTEPPRVWWRVLTSTGEWSHACTKEVQRRVA